MKTSSAGAPPPVPVNDLDAADAFVWHAEREWLEPVPAVNRVAIELLRGIEPFPTKELMPYDPGYVAGWVVEARRSCSC